MIRIRVSIVLTPNDAGATGSNQAGVAVKKSGPLIDFFPPLDSGGENPDVMLDAYNAHSGEPLGARYVYYNNRRRGGTRDEYRLVRISSFLATYDAVAGDVLLIAQMANGSYWFGIERLLPSNSELRSTDYIDTRLDEGLTIGLPSTALQTDDEANNMEGKEYLVLSRRYERSPINRRMAIEAHGRICKVCYFSFDASYGPLAAGYIEVHHLVPVSLLPGPTPVDPEEELIPLCANCHRMAHRRWPPYTPKELQTALSDNSPLNEIEH